MKKYLYLALALTVSACAKEDITTIYPQEETTPNIVVPEEAIEGEVIIKFSPEMEAILDATMTRSGIPSTD